MLGLALPALMAMLVARALGGSRSNWSNPHVRLWPLAALSLGLQVLLFSPPLDTQPWAIVWGPWLYVGTLVGVMSVLLRNVSVHGVGRVPLTVAALGVALNCLVVSVNAGYMPRSDEAVATLHGQAPHASAEPRLVNVVSISGETRLEWLGDVIAQPKWLPMANVVSIGDLLLSGGLAWWVFRFNLGRW